MSDEQARETYWRPVTRRGFLQAAGVLILGSCATASVSGPTRSTDPLAAQPSSGRWPALYRNAAPVVQEAYAYAAANPEVLRFIPCYCGCGGADHGSHQNNADCYVRTRSADGWMILDPHGASCGVCVAITQEVHALAREGTPLATIRTRIDQKWSKSGPATLTPLPG